MIAAIDNSIPSYISGIRCWGAFCDALSVKEHFHARPDLVQRFVSLFQNVDTLRQYLKHLSWAHRFLHIPVTWHDATLDQMLRGSKKYSAKPKPRIALTSTVVARMIKCAIDQGDLQTATIMALSRLFMLRVPSECLPLTWQGAHSSVKDLGESLSIGLARRKNSSSRVTMTRRACAAHRVLTCVRCISYGAINRSHGMVACLTCPSRSS